MTTSTLQHNDNKAVEVENRVIKKAVPPPDYLPCLFSLFSHFWIELISASPA